jgi:hypothetical protein
VRASLGVTPAALLSHSEASLPLLHHRVLQLALPDNRHIRLLAVDAHDDDIRVTRLTVIRPHQGVLLLDELPAKLEEVRLRDDWRQGRRIPLRKTPSRHRSHTPEDRTNNVCFSLHPGQSRQPQRCDDLLRYRSDIRSDINRLSVDEAEMDTSRRALARAGTHGPPLIRTHH